MAVAHYYSYTMHQYVALNLEFHVHLIHNIDRSVNIEINKIRNNAEYKEP
jgi:hypothetical protein